MTASVVVRRRALAALAVVGEESELMRSRLKGGTFSLLESPSRVVVDVRARLGFGVGSGDWSWSWSQRGEDDGSDRRERFPRTELRVARGVCMAATLVATLATTLATPRETLDEEKMEELGGPG